MDYQKQAIPFFAWVIPKEEGNTLEFYWWNEKNSEGVVNLKCPSII